MAALLPASLQPLPACSIIVCWPLLNASLLYRHCWTSATLGQVPEGLQGHLPGHLYLGMSFGPGLLFFKRNPCLVGGKLEAS